MHRRDFYTLYKHLNESHNFFKKNFEISENFVRYRSKNNFWRTIKIIM